LGEQCLATVEMAKKVGTTTLRDMYADMVKFAEAVEVTEWLASI